MRNGADMVELIQKSAVAAVEAASPCGLYLGTVTSTAPLAVQLDQKMTLTAEFLMLSTLVQEFKVDMTVDHWTEDTNPPTTHAHPDADVNSFDATHKHAYKGRKTFLVHLGLQAGERVFLIREQGGNRYLIIDRIRGDE